MSDINDKDLSEIKNFLLRVNIAMPHNEEMIIKIEKLLAYNEDRNNQVMCCLGKAHPCKLNVNDGYCAAESCQYQVLEAKLCDHNYAYKILRDHSAADVCTKCGNIKKQK